MGRFAPWALVLEAGWKLHDRISGAHALSFEPALGVRPEALLDASRVSVRAGLHPLEDVPPLTKWLHRHLPVGERPVQVGDHLRRHVARAVLDRPRVRRLELRLAHAVHVNAVPATSTTGRPSGHLLEEQVAVRHSGGVVARQRSRRGRLVLQGDDPQLVGRGDRRLRGHEDRALHRGHRRPTPVPAPRPLGREEPVGAEQEELVETERAGESLAQPVGVARVHPPRRGDDAQPAAVRDLLGRELEEVVEVVALAAVVLAPGG